LSRIAARAVLHMRSNGRFGFESRQFGNVGLK